jgi:hypothetical protein
MSIVNKAISFVSSPNSMSGTGVDLMGRPSNKAKPESEEGSNDESIDIATNESETPSQSSITTQAQTEAAIFNRIKEASKISDQKLNELYNQGPTNSQMLGSQLAGMPGPMPQMNMPSIPSAPKSSGSSSGSKSPSSQIASLTKKLNATIDNQEKEIEKLKKQLVEKKQEEGIRAPKFGETNNSKKDEVKKSDGSKAEEEPTTEDSKKTEDPAILVATLGVDFLDGDDEFDIAETA